jgi:hypothetical protein
VNGGKGTHLVRLVEHDPRQVADLTRPERKVECLALQPVLLALRDEHARAEEAGDRALRVRRLLVHVRVRQDVRERARVRRKQARALQRGERGEEVQRGRGQTWPKEMYETTGPYSAMRRACSVPCSPCRWFPKNQCALSGPGAIRGPRVGRYASVYATYSTNAPSAPSGREIE